MRAALACLLLALAGIATAQDVPALAAPTPGSALHDKDFGVRTRQFGLQRSVRMLQWNQQGNTFAKVWSDAPIASAGYPPANRNPGEFPLKTRYWIADHASLDGKPIDDDVLKALGQWRDFRPNFSALPGNLAATFQPEGDGLGSADNPLDPQIGDLRVTWRELMLPPLAGKVALAQGAWVMKPDTEISAAAVPKSAADVASESAKAMSHLLPFGLGILVVILALFAARRHRERARND